MNIRPKHPIANDIETSYPLAPMQQGMVLHSVSSVRPGVYVQQLLCTLHESLQLPLFIRAWEQVIERHPILRTTFCWEGVETPLQYVHRQLPLAWELHDWRGYLPDVIAERLHRYLQIDRQRGFDLCTGPLMRLALMRCDEGDYRCVWTYHHALLDGRSRLQVTKEVFALYDAACQGQATQLPPIRPYRDYIAWLQQQDVTKAEAFWRERLSGFHSSTPFVIDSQSETAPEYIQGNEEQELILTEDFTATVHKFVQEHGLTVNTVLQGVWALLLSRYSGEDDIVFGSTRACRRSALGGTSEEMVGLFINTLPMRVRLPSDMAVLSWLHAVRAQQVAVREYEHTPLSMVQTWSEVAPGAPLFESLMLFEKHRVVDESLRAPTSKWTNRSFELYEQTGYPLTFAGYDGVQLTLTVEYDRARFTAAVVSRMLGHLQTLIGGIVAHPQQSLAEVPLLTEGERRQLLIAWNDTARSYPQEACIHELFELQAQRTPEASAIEQQGQRLTYAELDQRANQLAQYLRKLGVGPETLVGLCVERSLDMAVGILGILKAGGAYVPLDPSYPKDRLAFMLADAQVMVLITQQHLAEVLPASSTPLLFLDADWSQIAQESTEKPPCDVTADNLAYVIYTSGSTGKPKGVLTLHRGVVNHCMAMMEQFALQPYDRVLQFACVSFDASVEELFPTWASGATLVPRPREMLGSVLDFLRAVEQERITVLNLPTAFWHELVHGVTIAEACLPPSVRLVIVGGEKASAGVLASWFQLTDASIRWINTYGPTEGTVSATVYEPDPTVRGWNPSVEIPIGRPLANVQTYVLDQEQRVVPVGVPGELCIGGIGLARGYLRRPELTMEKFIAHPFSSDPTARLYRTGDRARYLPDGNLEFLGRLDSQVKLRGLRIELGEIEAVLGQHPAIHEAVVLARETVAGDKQLVGYVVPNAQETVTPEMLHAFLQARLPAYMAPTRFVLLDAFPLTSNGKVNRRALPAPEGGVDVASGAVAPRDEFERLLVQVWEELFQCRPIGIRDNFFALGGHSLLAIRMLSKVQQLTGKQVPLAALFKEGTIEQLASLLRQSEQAPHSCLVGIQPKGTKPPFFCVHGAGGGVFWYNDLARRLGANQPFYGIESPGVEDPAAIDAPIETLALQYLEAIRTVQPHGPYLLGGYSMGGIIAFEMARQLRASGQGVALLAVFDTWGPGSHPGFTERLLRVMRRFWHMPVNQKAMFLHAKGAWLTRSLREWWSVGFLDRKMWRLQRLKKANVQAVHAYAPRPYAGALTLFRAQTQRVTAMPDPYLGWNQLVTGGIEVHEIPGDHYSMFTSPHSRVFASQLRDCLGKAQRVSLPGGWETTPTATALPLSAVLVED